MTSSRKIFAALALALALGACTTPSTNVDNEMGAQNAVVGEGNREPASFSGARKAVDDQCFVEYSHAAGLCNSSAGEDDVAFSKCLKPVKSHLRACCVKNGGTAKCAADAAPASHGVKKSVDNKCGGDYSQEIARCHRASGGSQKALAQCVASVNDELKGCCKQYGGTTRCASPANEPATERQKEVDDQCFMDYVNNMSQCTPADGSDNMIGECIKPLQDNFRYCCKDKGGSADCAAEAH